MHIFSKNNRFQECTKHTKIDIMLLSFWLHIGTHKSLKMRYWMTLQHKEVWSYAFRPLVGHLKENLEARYPDNRRSVGMRSKFLIFSGRFVKISHSVTLIQITEALCSKELDMTWTEFHLDSVLLFAMENILLAKIVETF